MPAIIPMIVAIVYKITMRRAGIQNGENTQSQLNETPLVLSIKSNITVAYWTTSIPFCDSPMAIIVFVKVVYFMPYKSTIY